MRSTPMFRAPPVHALRALLCAVSLSASCTLQNIPPTDDPEYGAGPLALVASDPPSGGTGVGRLPSIVLTFDGFPDPGSVASFGPLSLHSGTNSLDYVAHVDLVGRAIVMQPRNPLAPDTQYTAQIRSSIRSLDGRSPPRDLFVRFTTGPSTATTTGGDRHGPAPRSLAADVQPRFDRSCALAGCHDAEARAGALDLSSAKASLASLVCVAAVQVKLARVVSGVPESSYVLRKLLGTPGIQSAPMPPGNRWADDDIRVVSDWIATGATP